jgi:DNA-binding PucR family transcriptional regulator
LTALIDGDVSGFVLPSLPVGPAPTMIGLSEPAPLIDFRGPFRRATRALETSLTFGVDGMFTFSSLVMQAAVLRDRDIADVLRARYVEPLLSSAGGEGILDTLERLLANDQNVAVTASALGVHPNTVRHRIKRFEELTGASIGEQQTTIELWWALQGRQLTGR